MEETLAKAIVTEVESEYHNVNKVNIKTIAGVLQIGSDALVFCQELIENDANAEWLAALAKGNVLTWVEEEMDIEEYGKKLQNSVLLVDFGLFPWNTTDDQTALVWRQGTEADRLSARPAYYALQRGLTPANNELIVNGQTLNSSLIGYPMTKTRQKVIQPWKHGICTPGNRGRVLSVWNDGLAISKTIMIAANNLKYDTKNKQFITDFESKVFPIAEMFVAPEFRYEQLDVEAARAELSSYAACDAQLFGEIDALPFSWYEVNMNAKITGIDPTLLFMPGKNGGFVSAVELMDINNDRKRVLIRKRVLENVITPEASRKKQKLEIGRHFRSTVGMNRPVKLEVQRWKLKNELKGNCVINVVNFGEPIAVLPPQN